MNETLRGPNGRVVIGVLLVVLGALWTLENLGIPGLHDVVRWWPALLLVYGVIKLLGLGVRRGLASGGFFTAAGTLMLLDRLGLAHVGLGILLPLLMICWGIAVLRRGSAAANPPAGAETSGEWVRSFATMAAARTRGTGQALRGGELTAVAGGVEVDLRAARTVPEGAVFDVLAIWGGIEVVVPETWRVESEVTSIVGGVDDQRRATGEGAIEGRLLLRGLAMMGGIVVRNEPSAGQVRIRTVRQSRRGEVVREVHVGPGGVSVTRERPDGGRHRVVVGVGMFTRENAPGAGASATGTPGAAPGPGGADAPPAGTPGTPPPAGTPGGTPPAREPDLPRPPEHL